MTPMYTYTSSPEYINLLKFDYVETYTFQRGGEYELQNKKEQDEYNKLKTQKAFENGLTQQDEEEYKRLDKSCGITQYIVDDNNHFHISSRKTNTFAATDSKITLLKSILSTEVKDVPLWMCAPMYRDAIVFYDSKRNILSTLNVCFSCQYIETSMFNYLNADVETYHLLEQFFEDIGHNIEK